MVKKTAVTILILLVLFSLLLIAGKVGSLTNQKQDTPFENLSLEEMHEKIISQRDLAIQKAMKEGKYKCCINPPCTMCFMEANQWNNFTAGTCACDDLLAQGKEACPQCQRGLCETNKEGFCKTGVN